MKDRNNMILVGDTGFVGSNLLANSLFDSTYHSTNVHTAYDSCPDILIYAGVPGTKFLANRFPYKDKQKIDEAITNIKRISAKKLVLISTVDVNSRLDVFEDELNERSYFGAYGDHRALLEKWVEENYTDYHIIRLPAIYGINLKKNYIRDLISAVPLILTPQKYETIKFQIPEINEVYILEPDGLYHYNYKLGDLLNQKFLNNKFNALSFTCQNSSFQYYNLKWLSNDIQRIITEGIKKINLVTEPIYSYELFDLIYNTKFSYEYDNSAICVNYNLKTRYDQLLKGQNGYLYDKTMIINDLVYFINNEKRKLGLS